MKKRSQRVWTTARIVEAAKASGSAANLRLQNRPAYMAAYRAGCLHSIFHILASGGKKSKKAILELAWRYESKATFEKFKPDHYHSACLSGAIRSITFGGRNPASTELTEADIRARASVRKNKHDMKQNDLRAYTSALRLGIINDIFEDQRPRWTVERIRAIAATVSTKKALYRLKPGAYDAALRLGIINDLFSNEYSHNTRDCIYLWQMSESVFKVGITSSCLGDQRIKEVAKLVGCEPKLLALSPVGHSKAIMLERDIKSLGERHEFAKRFDGHTEFIVLSERELNDALNMISRACATGKDRFESTD